MKNPNIQSTIVYDEPNGNRVGVFDLRISEYPCVQRVLFYDDPIPMTRVIASPEIAGPLVEALHTIAVGQRDEETIRTFRRHVCLLPAKPSSITLFTPRPGVASPEPHELYRDEQRFIDILGMNTVVLPSRQRVSARVEPQYFMNGMFQDPNVIFGCRYGSPKHMTAEWHTTTVRHTLAHKMFEYVAALARGELCHTGAQYIQGFQARTMIFGSAVNWYINERYVGDVDVAK